MKRLFRYDKWNNILGCQIPNGAEVEIVKFMPKRRVLISYKGKLTNTMLWCVPK